MNKLNFTNRYRSESPILTADKSWEEGASLRAVSVFSEENGKRLRLYYLVWYREEPVKNALCVAYSQDGLNWEKPDLGEGNNVVMRGSGCRLNWGVFFPQQVIFDPHCEDKDLCWKMVYWDRPTQEFPQGLCLAASTDGLTWKPLFDYPIITNQNDGSCLITANERNPIRWLECKYYIYQQTWKYNPARSGERESLPKVHRHISIWAAKTFGRGWIGPTVVLEPDEDDPSDHQFYWLTPFHTNKGYGGFLTVLHSDDQTVDLQIVTSLDGWEWQRENNRYPILTPGDPGRFDCGMVFSICGPMRVGEKVYILYGGQSWTHDQRPAYPDVNLEGPEAGIGVAEVDPGILDMNSNPVRQSTM
jgi:hypothetical protein